MLTHSMSYTRKDISSTEIEFSLSLPYSDFQKKYEAELAEVAKQVKVSGFRPGKAPVTLIGDERRDEVRRHVLEHFISDEANDVLRKEKVVPALPPSVSISKFEEGKSIEFLLKALIIPKITLPAMSSLKTKKAKVSVEEKDIDAVEKSMWEQHRGKFKDKTDAWVAAIAPKLGFKSKTRAELREEIKKAVEYEKDRIATQQFAHDALMEAIELAKVTVPEKVIKYEAQERERSFLSTLHDMNMTVDEYTKNRKVTMEEMRKQWEKDSKEAVETDVLLSEYARDRKITLTPEELETEVQLIKMQSKNPSDAVFDNPEWRGYISRVVLKRKSVQAFTDELRSLASEPNDTSGK